MRAGFGIETLITSAVLAWIYRYTATYTRVSHSSVGRNQMDAVRASTCQLLNCQCRVLNLLLIYILTMVSPLRMALWNQIIGHLSICLKDSSPRALLLQYQRLYPTGYSTQVTVYFKHGDLKALQVCDQRRLYSRFPSSPPLQKMKNRKLEKQFQQVTCWYCTVHYAWSSARSRFCHKFESIFFMKAVVSRFFYSTRKMTSCVRLFMFHV
jgi:hypothetical protein